MSRSLIPPTLFFFIKIDLTTWGILYFHKNFEFFFFVVVVVLDLKKWPLVI